MKNIYLLFLIVICIITFRSVHAFQPHQYSSFEKVIDSILVNYTGTNKPGATIGIIKEGKLLFQKGYGMANLQLQKANTPQVVYNISSGSKQFTAFAIASLIDQQKISLTDTIGQFLPEFPKYGKNITIENLLYHTSGIRDYMVLMWLTGKSFEGAFSNQDALAMIIRQSKLNFKPGERCVYSNSNYILLTEIIQRITGKTLSAYSATLIQTLEMNSSGFDEYRRKEKIVSALSYFKSGDRYLPYANEFIAYGDGGMRTTLQDLTRWDKLFYDSTSLVQALLKRGTLNNGDLLSYGMGLQFSSYRNEPIQTDAGAFLGFRSEILRFPARKISIICLGNSEDINPKDITRSIADVVVFEDKRSAVSPQVNINKVVSKSIRTEEAELFTGIYQVVPNVFIHIRQQEGQLSGQVSGQPQQMLYVESSATFKVGGTSDKVMFENLTDRKYRQLTVVQKQGNTTAQRLQEIIPEDYLRFTGTYYSHEQNAMYQFYSKNGNLYFKTGSNAEVEAHVLTLSNRVYFDYKYLEQATIDFIVDNNNKVNGFLLNSGRVNDIRFEKKQ